MTARNRIHPAATFLIRAFSPGCPTMLRSWSAKLERRGERVILLYDLPSDAAHVRAAELVRGAAAYRLVKVGDKAINELSAELHGDFSTLTVSALLVKA